MQNIDTDEITRVYNSLESKVTNTLDKYLDNNDIKSEDKAIMISNTIGTLLSRSFDSLALGSNLRMNEEKLEQTRRMTPFMLDGARINNDTLQQKYITEQLRNGGISFKYTFYCSYLDDDGTKVETDFIDQDTITVPVEQTTTNEDGTTTTATVNKEYVLFRDYKRVASKEITEGTSLSTVELQNNQIIAQTEYAQTQKTELSASVIYNNKLKVLSSLSSLWGTLGAGGLVVPEIGWEPVFEIASELGNTTLPSLSSFQADITSK